MALQTSRSRRSTPSASATSSRPRAWRSSSSAIARGRELLDGRTLLERQLHRARRRGRRDAALADRLRARCRPRRALGDDRRRPGVLRASPSACTTACTATPATAGRWATPSARSTSASPPSTPSCSPQRVAPRDVVLLHDPQTAGMVAPLRREGVPVIWRAHIGLDLPERPRARGVALPHRLRRAGRRLRLLPPRYAWEGLDASKVTVIAPSIDAFSPEEPRDVVHRGDRGAAAAGLAADDHHRLAGDLRAPRRHRRAGRARGAASSRRTRCASTCRSRPGLALGPAQGPAGHRVGASPSTSHADEEPHLLLAGPGRDRGGRRPGGRRGLRRGRGGVARAPAAGPPPRAPRAAADGRRRRERGDGQRAAAPRRRRRPEEPRRGLRAHRRRGDVEGPPGRRVRRRRHPGPDRGRADRVPRRRRPTSTPSPTASTACSPIPTRRAHGRGRRRPACATSSSARATWASTSSCSRACSTR